MVRYSHVFSAAFRAGLRLLTCSALGHCVCLSLALAMVLSLSVISGGTQASWEEMEACDIPVRKSSNGLQRQGGLPDGLIVSIGGEEEETWPPWKWAEEECHAAGGLSGGDRGGGGGAAAAASGPGPAPKSARAHKGRVPSTRVTFPQTQVGDVSVVKVALCNRSRSDAVIRIEAAHPSAFRVRHRLVRVRAEHYLMLPVYFVPVETGKAREKLSIVCPDLGFSRHLILSASAV